MPATAEPPVQQVAPPAEGGGSFSERMAAARSESQAVGGVEGEIVPPKPVVSDPKKIVEPAKKVDAEAPKKDDKPQSTEKSKEEKPKTESLADKMAKIREGNLEEVQKPETKTEETKPDLSKLTKEQKEAHTYKTLREKADKYESTQKELEEFKAKLNGGDPDGLLKQVEALQKEVQEKQNKLAAYDITQSDKYQNEVSTPLGKILKELQDKSKGFGFPWKDFVDAVEKPTSDEREQALSAVLAAAEKEVNPLTQLSILSSVNEYLQRQEFGDALIQNASAAREAMKAEESKKSEMSKKQSEMEFSRVSDIVFDHVINPDLAEDMPFLFTEKKDSDGNLIIDAAKAKAIRDSAVFGETPPHIRALQSYSTELLPMVVADNKTLRKQKAELEERISQLSEAGPSVEQKSQSQESSDEDSKLTLEQKIAKIRRSQGQ